MKGVRSRVGDGGLDRRRAGCAEQRQPSASSRLALDDVEAVANSSRSQGAKSAHAGLDLNGRNGGRGAP